MYTTWGTNGCLDIHVDHFESFNGEYEFFVDFFLAELNQLIPLVISLVFERFSVQPAGGAKKSDDNKLKLT